MTEPTVSGYWPEMQPGTGKTVGLQNLVLCNSCGHSFTPPGADNGTGVVCPQCGSSNITSVAVYNGQGGQDGWLGYEEAQVPGPTIVDPERLNDLLKKEQRLADVIKAIEDQIAMYTEKRDYAREHGDEMLAIRLGLRVTALEALLGVAKEGRTDE